MNQESQTEFDRIVGLDPQVLTEPELAFLKARSGYLTDEQSAKFASVLGEVTETPKRVRKSAKTDEE